MTDPRERPLGLPPASPPANEGNTVAAWVTVAIILVGGLVACLGVVLARPVMFWTGVGVAVVALVVGRVLKMLGFGQPSARS